MSQVRENQELINIFMTETLNGIKDIKLSSKENNFLFEKHLLKGDSHTISPKAINLLQKFIKKNL